MAAPLQSPAFTQKVVAAMRSLYPEEIADRRWDNVGLLQDNIDPSHPLAGGAGGARDAEPVSPVVMLTNDLTVRVAEEAISRKASVIVTYHPFIFRGLKSITLDNPHQRVVLLLARHNIAVYSPHTAVDAAPDGVNDWLAQIACSCAGGGKVSVVQPLAAPAPKGFENAGYGRLIEFPQGGPVGLGALLDAYARELGVRHISVALPADAWGIGSVPVRSLGVCAGSGSDVLSGCRADAILTGEMSHHDALKLTMEGKAVVTVFHSNSERGYLRAKMQHKLRALLVDEYPDAQVLVSEEDRDPFVVYDTGTR